jgi:hypothetical protein
MHFLSGVDTPNLEATPSENSALPAPTAIHIFGNVTSGATLIQPYGGSNPHPPQRVTVYPMPAPQCADLVLNLLSRRRQPDPMPTILTPDALRLRHASIADCARYDQLRRAAG